MRSTFTRIVTDEVTLAWLGDVFVDGPWRGRGVGRALVGFAVDHPRLAGVRKWLLGTADAHALYRPFGFQEAPEGRFMVRRGTAPARPGPQRRDKAG